MNAVKYSLIFDKLGKLNFKRKKKSRKVSLKCGCIGLKRCHWFGLVSSLMCYRTMWIILINELFFKISRLGFTIIDLYTFMRLTSIYIFWDQRGFIISAHNNPYKYIYATYALPI